MNTTFPFSNILGKLTPDDLKAINADVAARKDELRRRDLERRASGKPPQFPVTVISTAREAQEYRLNLELKWTRSPHETLKELKAEQSQLAEKIAALKAIVAKYPDDPQVQRQVRGYELRQPLVKGELPTFVHVDGLLALAEQRLLDLDPAFQALQIQCARYDADLAALKAWPPSRVARELNELADEAAILRGETPQRRGARY